jgi:hypothetical protein
MSSPQEVETMREGYVAAIEQLDAEGLIDPHKVGIIGFSRTGWYVLNTLLHATKYFAAATLAECSYISFGEYLMNADYSGRWARRPRNWAGAKLSIRRLRRTDCRDGVTTIGGGGAAQTCWGDMWTTMGISQTTF